MVQGFDQISCLYAFKRKICLWHTITPLHMISPVFVTVQDWTTTFWSQMASTSVSLDLGRTPAEPQAGSEDVSLLNFGGWIGRDAETNADGEQKENSTPKWKKSMKRGVFFSYPHSVVKKKRVILYTCALLPIFDNLISPPATPLTTSGKKISPWWECRQHEWKINTFNLHAEIAEKKKNTTSCL